MQIHETTLFLKFPLSLIDLLLFATNSVTLSLQPARFLKKKVPFFPDVRLVHINTCKRDGDEREGWGDGEREAGMIEKR